jgi:site-specific DNA recombinase
MTAAYLRVSTEMQDVETQRAMIRDHCAKRNIIPEEFADDAVSGTVPFNDRPQSRRLLDEAKKGNIHEVIVYRVDRLGRDYLDTLTAIAELSTLGVSIESLKEGRIVNTASGRFHTNVLTAASQFERESTVERTIDKMRDLAKAGVWVGGTPPYGFCKVGEGKQAVLALSETPISPTCNLSAVDVVRLIFQKAADGWTCDAIATHLNNDLGIPPAYKDRLSRDKERLLTKGIWLSLQVRNAIINRTYMGEHVWGKQELFRKHTGRKNLRPVPQENWITRQCPAIVTEDLWNRANAVLHRNQTTSMGRANSMGRPKYKYLLRGLIRCQCGRTYIGVTAKQRNGTVRAYYRCASLYADPSIRAIPHCTCPGLRGEVLEASVWDYVQGFLARPGLAIQELKNQMAAESDQSLTVKREISILEGRLLQKAEARQRVLAQVAEGLFQGDEIKVALRRIEDDAAGAQKRLAEFREISVNAETRVLALDWAGRLLGDLRAKVKGQITFEKKRKFVETLVAGITVSGTKAVPEVEVRFRFDSDFDCNPKLNRRLVPDGAGSRT